MTIQSRLLAAEADFNAPSQVPPFSIEKEPFSKFYVQSAIDLPIIPPFTKEAHKYFDTPSLRSIAGIEQCEESGNYIITACSELEEDNLYRALTFFTY